MSDAMHDIIKQLLHTVDEKVTSVTDIVTDIRVKVATLETMKEQVNDTKEQVRALEIRVDANDKKLSTWGGGLTVLMFAVGIAVRFL